jgi:uncharacterized oxidoreductase
MPVFSAEQLRSSGERLLAACGASADEARAVASELVDASLRGIDSHGVVRLVMYADHVRDGTIKPGAPITIERETPGAVVVDCHRGFGIVGALRMADIVAEKARGPGIACAASLGLNHIGRLGAYPERLARLGLFGLATVNSPRHGHFVSPWGGREGRLATNPLAWAAPSGSSSTGGAPLVMDMSTSMIAEGKIRILMQEGKQVPAGSILDADGNPTTDPKKFYGPPRGTILPFGSPAMGYKGFGLSLLVEILGAALAGVPLTPPEGKEPYGNGLFLLAIDPEAFGSRERFRKLVGEFADYVSSSAPAPGTDGVVLPGALERATRERRLREGIPLSDETWRQIHEAGRRAGVEL